MAGVTVVVVSDFEPNAGKSWRDEIAMLNALASQDVSTEFPVIVAESSEHDGTALPPAMRSSVPKLQMHYVPSTRSATLKDSAVAECRTPYVVVVEADALPEPDWLRRICETAELHPDADVVSGRTYYGEESSWQRIMNLIGRSFDDSGATGPSESVSNNGALYKTEALRQFPYPPGATPFLSARRRNAQMRAAGLRFHFCREARMRHAIGGMRFAFDVHRNAGYSDLMISGQRSLWGAICCSARRVKRGVGVARTLGRQYLKPRDWPLWVAAFAMVRLPEWVGMIEAIRVGEQQFLAGSDYR